MMEKLCNKLCSILIPLLGWLAGRLGLAVVAVDELGRLRERDGRPVLPPGFAMFNTELAAAHGIDEAVMLATFAGWIDHNAAKGRTPWTYNSAEKWVEQEFPWLSVSTYRRKIKKLGEAGLLDVCQVAQSFDRRLRVSLTTAARLSSPSAQTARPSTQIEQMGLPFRPHDLQDSEHNPPIPKSITPAASSRGRVDGAAAAATIAQNIADILDSRENADRSADQQPEGGEVRHARRTAPPPVPAAPLPHPDEMTTELDAQEPHPPAPSPSHQNAGEGEVSAAISGVFAERVARELIARYGAGTVEAMIADTRQRGKVANLAGLVRTRLADGDRVAVATPYTGGRWAGVVQS